MNQLKNLRTAISKKDLPSIEKYESAVENTFKEEFNPCSRIEMIGTDINLNKYIKNKPKYIESTRRYIYIQRLGKFSKAEQEVVEKIAEYLAVFFQVEVKMMEDLDESLIIDDAYIYQHGKVSLEVDYLIYNLISDFVPRSAIALIAITNYAIYCPDDEGYLMGIGLMKFRSALWTLESFDCEGVIYDIKKQIEYILKLSIHEAGHVFSFPHCDKYECIMGIVSNHYLDSSPVCFCPTCLSKLFYLLDVDELFWLEQQKMFWEKNGF